MSNEIIARGSWGDIHADAVTGKVLRIEDDSSTDKEGERGYRDIERLDLDEWRRTYPAETLTETDILDLGYWNKDGRYEPPVADYRKDVRP